VTYQPTIVHALHHLARKIACCAEVDRPLRRAMSNKCGFAA
jgi:hypothetical protein